MNQDDLLRGAVIQQLMCQGEIDIAAVEDRYDIEFESYFAEALRKLPSLVADGLAYIESSRIAVTSRGRPLLRIIAMCFDRYLAGTAETALDRPRYSRVI